MAISQTSSGTVSLIQEAINIGSVAVLNNTASTINPMAMTGGSITFSNTSGTVQINGALSTTSTVPVTFGTGSITVISTSTVQLAGNQTGTIPVSFGTGTVTIVSTSTVIFSSTSGTVNIGGFSASVFSGTFATTSPTNTGGGATSTVVSVGTSASTLLSASASRVYAHFRHATVSTGTIFIRHGLIPTTTNYDTYLNMTTGGGDTYEITQTNLWTGDVQAISSVNTSSISIVAF